MARVAMAVAALASSSIAFAQMCPACYQNAAAQAPGMLQSLKTGVLVMILPTMAMFVLIFGAILRRRHRFYDGSEQEVAFDPGRADGELPDAAPFDA